VSTHAPSAVAIIPARLGSTRFPRKVLADATGKPLIQHVVERARLAARLSRVVVATDADEVRRAVQAFGGECVMTSAAHPNGTSRLAEAADVLGLGADAIVVNVQGDEPEVEPGAIDAAVDALDHSGAEVATVASPFEPGDDPANPNLVKVVVSKAGLALYFSRAAIPHRREPQPTGELASTYLRHVGLYAYRADYLRRYAGMEPTPLEQTEALEQLRVLETGGRIAVARHRCLGTGIDTPEQYQVFVERTPGAR
jgi:3-deoxy-manno-octulosonate cytidylyltransferase (CMP-KDO synthetase)